MKKIVGVMALHRREKIAAMSIERLQERQCLPVEMVVVGDSEVEQKVAADTGAHYVQISNWPLSNKWQAGIEKARELDPDGVLIMGSDDWITDGWLAQAIKCIETQDVDLVGKMEWEICDVRPEKTVILHQEFIDGRRTRPIGAGRLFRRQILDRINWELFPHGINRGLDLASFQSIKSVGGTWRLMKGERSPRLLLIRADWACCNPWKKLTGGLEGISSSRTVPHPERWINKFYPDGWEKLRSLLT